jgi:hypothetical protein
MSVLGDYDGMAISCPVAEVSLLPDQVSVSGEYVEMPMISKLWEEFPV